MGFGNIKNSKAVIYSFSALAIFLWGFSYIWSNQLIEYDIPIYYFVTIRIAIAGVILLLFNLVTRQFQKIRSTKDLLLSASHSSTLSQRPTASRRLLRLPSAPWS